MTAELTVIGPIVGGCSNTQLMLTVRDHMMLTLEQSWWKYPGAKDSTIRELFSMRPTRYYQCLGALLERPEAEAEYPMLVRRLRRVRAERQAQRSQRRASEARG